MIFITFEGPEGSGKTTQIQLLERYLKSRNIDVVKTREPGGSILAEKIRELLLDPENKKMAPSAELLLYLASRAQHVQDKIMPALKNGKAVICDRFSDSTMAYQGYARGISKDLIKNLDTFATCGLKPDLTLYIDIDVGLGLRRARKRSGSKDRLELEKASFHNKVRKGYLALAKKEPRRIKVICGERTIEEISEQILFYTRKILKK
ncbi:MAG: dTMP kinase [Candidatus Firestonebacteria bacterium RIFOXYA2_FULL_40_8]|nr:MAG: dTMP kinase [Candidatus Firestonebacteria bacterium RIFOXYA2_FULL_40_8]